MYLARKHPKFWRKNIQNFGGKTFKIFGAETFQNLARKYPKFWLENIPNFCAKIFKIWAQKHLNFWREPSSPLFGMKISPYFWRENISKMPRCPIARARMNNTRWLRVSFFAYFPKGSCFFLWGGEGVRVTDLFPFAHSLLVLRGQSKIAWIKFTRMFTANSGNLK